MRHDQFLQLLHSWQGFYSLLGEAAATLTGLMFVAASLGAAFISEETRSQIRTFVTPNVINYTQVLLLSAFMNVPDQTPLSLAFKFMALGLVGLSYTLSNFRSLLGFHRDGRLKLHGWIWNFVLPLLCALSLIGGALVLQRNVSDALTAVAAGALILTTVGLHNAWEITLELARRTPNSSLD